MEPSLASIDLAMYQSETMMFKDILEYNYDQPEMDSYYSFASNETTHGIGPLETNINGTPRQSVPYDTGYTFDSFVPKMETNMYDPSTTTLSPCRSPDQLTMTNICTPPSSIVSHKSASGTVSSTLPTPPQSPPSNETDLDNIIATIPEILERHPSFLFPAVEDVLLDLEMSPCCGQLNNLSYPTPPAPLEERASLWNNLQSDIVDQSKGFSLQQIPKALKKDSMWGGGAPILGVEDDHRLKTRTISESSEDYRLHCVYSDEEYEHLPDTPCVSDEDVEHLDAKEVSTSLNDLPVSATVPVSSPSTSVSLTPRSVASPSTPTNPAPRPRWVSSPSTSVSHSPAYQAAPCYANSVSSEHNYCEKGPAESYSHDVDTDEEVDVVSYEVPPKSSPSPSSSPLFCGFDTTSGSLVSPPLTATLPHSPSSQVKKQLQIAIHESLKNKQKKGRVGRPPKALKTASANSSVPSFALDLPGDISGVLLKAHTKGKPASYTKRMREQHSEVLKTNKRRRISCKDPEEELEKRCNHNIMERNRRVNIKNLFDTLRKSVPEIKDNERASKVLILNKSRDYIEQLEQTSVNLGREMTTEMERNHFLRKRLHAMQSLIH